MRGRKTPYTATGIRRVPCVRCGAPSRFQWQICSDDNVFRPFCADCDILLNEMVLRWAGFPDREAKMARYRAEMRA